MASFTEILRRVSDFRGVSIEDLLGPRRDREFAWPRQEVVYFARKHTTLSFSAISSRMRRDHTTLLYSFKMVEQRLKCDDYRADFVLLEMGLPARYSYRHALMFKSSRASA